MIPSYTIISTGVIIVTNELQQCNLQALLNLVYKFVHHLPSQESGKSQKILSLSPENSQLLAGYMPASC